MGYAVTDHIGKYIEANARGYGVVAVLSNGKGPTVWVRSELDALPVEEKTGLPYASKVKATDDAGKEVGVMHACGHDIHMTSLSGGPVARAIKDHGWTLVFIGQPAEETVAGARAMLEGRAYTRFPGRITLALHDMPGQLGGREAWMPAGIHDGKQHLRGCHHARHRGTWSETGAEQGPDRRFGRACAGAADDREPREFAPPSPRW